MRTVEAPPGETLLGPLEAVELVEAAGIRFVPTALAADVAAARGAAAGAGFPAVLKAGGLNHKTDSRGVVVGLDDEDAVGRAAEHMLADLGEAALPLLVQPQASGLEILAGIRRVPGLGASIVVGMGGTLAEVLADVASHSVPVDAEAASEMLRRLRSWPLLEGYRDAAPRDVEALGELIVALSALAEARPDVVELDLNPVFLGAPGEGAVAADVRVATAPAPGPGRRGRGGDLGRLLAPRSVAVVGVSESPGSVGAKVFDNLLDGGFAGPVVPVHPKRTHYREHDAVASLAEIDPAPDLVCVAVRAEQVPAITAEAAGLGCGALLVFSAGFAEASAEGAALQEAVAAAAASTEMRVAGPNSLGVLSPPGGVLASFAGMLHGAEARPGEVAIVTSSGALGSCLASRLWASGAGLSRWVSLGNEVDLALADYLEWLVDDEETRLVGAIVDHVADGPRLAAAIRALREAGKPLLACLLARTESGSTASQSHTGALVGSYQVRRDLLDGAGAVLVDDLQQLEDALALASRQPLPAGPRIGVVTASGGACTIVADEVESSGLSLPELPDQLRAELDAVLPAFASFANPLDITATITGDPSGFAAALRAFAESGAFDAVLVQFTTNADPIATATAREVIAAVERDGPPIFVARYGSAELAPEAMAAYRAAAVPVLDTPRRLIAAVDVLARCAATTGGKR